ncbi:MAG: hypothetical protein DRN04_19210 [Thermoprotei archaeon]|nr:MAG: hypothetical protein DRN04_19210 [Thermoprotei archaeon]
MRLRKGISPIVATTLLILVAIATGIVIYVFATGWVGTRLAETTGPRAVLVVESAYYNGTDFVLYVRNDGTAIVNITRAYITAPDGTVYVTNSTSPATYNNNGIIIYVSNTTGYPAQIPANGNPVAVAIGYYNASNGDKDEFPGASKGSGQVYTIKLVASDGSEVTVKVRT